MRHPELAARKPERPDKTRVQKSWKEVVDQYFQLLTDNFEQHGLKERPAQVLNVKMLNVRIYI